MATCEIRALLKQKQHLLVLLLEQPLCCLANENVTADSQNFIKNEKGLKVRVATEVPLYMSCLRVKAAKVFRYPKLGGVLDINNT